MKIHIPNSAYLGNVDQFLRSFDPSDQHILEITANKKWISVHPVVLSMIAALGIEVGAENIRCENLEAKSRHYIERMGLFKICGISSGLQFTEHDATGRFIPLIRIKTSDELSHFTTQMIPLLHADRETATIIKYVISEAVRNVLEHARAKNGAILSAQYYKKSNTVRLGVADTGVGIREAINLSHPAATHLEALRLALMPGITGTTRREGGSEENAGAGLFFIKSIASVNSNFFVIYSGTALYKLLKTPPRQRLNLKGDPFKDRHSSTDNFPAWKGTVIGMDITLDQTREFSILLDALRKAYSKAIRERKKMRYKKPRFIP